MIWSSNIHLVVQSYSGIVHALCYVAQCSLACAQIASPQLIFPHKTIAADLTVPKQKSLHLTNQSIAAEAIGK